MGLDKGNYFFESGVVTHMYFIVDTIAEEKSSHLELTLCGCHKFIDLSFLVEKI